MREPISRKRQLNVEVIQVMGHLIIIQERRCSILNSTNVSMIKFLILL